MGYNAESTNYGVLSLQLTNKSISQDGLDEVVHSFILHTQLIGVTKRGGLEPIPGPGHTLDGFVTGLADRDGQTNTFTPMTNLESAINLHVFELWQDHEASGENAHTQESPVENPQP